MGRPKYDAARKATEADLLKISFSKTKEIEPKLTRKKIAAECGVSSAVFSQWVSGQTRIPDRHFVYLGRRLGFSPADHRPELAVTYTGLEGSDLILRIRKLNAEQRVIVTLFIEWLLEYKL
jgi:DNA-binding transcriptional regulator YdaS (Cro superfamily)